ncbi:lysoplasmalogenase [Caulobacter sp. FWC2]|uniref:lysoplasmalogenase n=1 Tax=Caulobacter sp. FWC2 TaxID=69664 RepID=UPI000C1458E4|nr:lysoplasmalogenase [Caulobacter sp. FWC2]PIB90454.1 lysoplasmalogenase [Caulobacter sp. FWC2]
MPGMSTAARWTLIASVIAGVSYVATWGLTLPPSVETAWKGAGVALLAVHAALRARSLDGWLLTAVMAFGAGGDVLLETHGLTVGAVSFLLGHVVASVLYLRHYRGGSVAPLVVAPAVVWASRLLSSGDNGVTAYSLFLAVMAATALMSRFPFKTVGLGALMFVVSDLLIFGRLGPLPDNLITGLAVWGLYYFGQLLICLGVAPNLTQTAHPRESGDPS